MTTSEFLGALQDADPALYRAAAATNFFNITHLAEKYLPYIDRPLPDPDPEDFTNTHGLSRLEAALRYALEELRETVIEQWILNTSYETMEKFIEDMRSVRDKSGLDIRVSLTPDISFTADELDAVWQRCLGFDAEDGDIDE